MLYWQQRENFWKQYTHPIMQIYSLQCIIMHSACSALLLSAGYMYSPCTHRSLGHSHWSDRCSYRGCTLPGSDPSGHGRSLEHSSGKHRKILSKNIITAQQVAGQISLTKWQFTYCHERHCSTYSIEMFFSLTYMLSTWPVQWARAHQRGNEPGMSDKNGSWNCDVFNLHVLTGYSQFVTQISETHWYD